MMQDPYFADRGLFARIVDKAGSFLVTNPAFQMSGARAEVRGTVPRVGEHTDEILGALLDMAPARIAALRDKGAIK